MKEHKFIKIIRQKLYYHLYDYKILEFIEDKDDEYSGDYEEIRLNEFLDDLIERIVREFESEDRTDKLKEYEEYLKSLELRHFVEEKKKLYSNLEKKLDGVVNPTKTGFGLTNDQKKEISAQLRANLIKNRVANYDKIADDIMWHVFTVDQYVRPIK